MGDMADMHLDEMFLDSDCDGCDEYGCGIMCKYCGAGPFQWVETDRGWRLSDVQGVHSCRGKGNEKDNK